MRSAVSSTSSVCGPAAARLLIVGRHASHKVRAAKSAAPPNTAATRCGWFSASGRERDGQERAALVQMNLGGLAQLDADLGPSLYLMWDHALDGPAEEPGVQGPPVVGHRDGRVGQVEEHGAIRRRDPVL